MKRSEMIEKIKDELSYYLKDEDYDLDRLAMALLDKCEGCGMLPPITKNKNFQGGHRIDIEPFYINEWE